MATRRLPSRLPARAPTPIAQARISIEYVAIDSIEPYALNAREIAEAVPVIAASIQEFGFRVPILLDDENVIVAGHTRVEAARTLGLTEVPATRTTGLSRAQIDAFRLVDNKSAEISQWKTDLLGQEITRLAGAGITWTDFGWRQEEIDCLNEMVSNDCLDTATLPPADTTAHAERRAPTQTRFVLGELVFFMPSAQYRSWIDGLRSLHSFVEDDIVADLKARLGLLS